MSLKVGDVYRSEVEVHVAASADVLVAGGGTAGCVAALAAARNGAEVLLVERHGYLGGMMTEGNAAMTMFIGYPGGRERRDGEWLYDRAVRQFAESAKRLREDPCGVQIVGGICMEIADRLLNMGAAIDTGGQAGTYVSTDSEVFKAVLFDMMEETGVELLLHCWTVDAIVEDDTVEGIVVENKSGRQVLLGQTVIDATGDADVAAKAGAPFNVGVAPDDISAKGGIGVGTTETLGMMYVYGNVDIERLFEFAISHREQNVPSWSKFQTIDAAYEAFGKGDIAQIYMPDHKLEGWTLPIPGLFLSYGCDSPRCGLSVRDLTAAEVRARKTLMGELAYLKKNIPGFENAYLAKVPEISVRETRLILGEYVLTIEDLLESRQFEDGIGRGGHPIDVSEIPDSLMARGWDCGPDWSFSIPYRCLVPQRIENLLVAGRCISATHEAFGCIRPTVQCMVTGQAAGTAAALCVKKKVTPRLIDTKQLCSTLKEQGVIL